MSDAPVPKYWRDAFPLIVWGILAFAFGFEGVALLLEGKWTQAILGFIGLIVLVAVVIHKDWLVEISAHPRPRTVAICVALAFSILLIWFAAPPIISSLRDAFSMQTPLLVTNFESDKRIDIENISDSDIYVDTLVFAMDSPDWSHSIVLNTLVESQKSVPLQLTLKVDPVEIIEPMGFTWADHVRAAMAKYKNCFRVLVFQKGNKSLEMMEQFHLRRGIALKTMDVEGTLSYHYAGHAKAKAESLALTATTVYVLPPICIPSATNIPM